MTGGHPCPNRNCKNYGYQCWDHCNFCGKDITMRPKGLDWGIKYTGPKPLNPDGSTHRCMKGGTGGRGYFKTEPVSTIDPKRELPPWPVPLPEGVHLGTTHLWYEGEFRKLYKCPLCSFQNIHKEVINHHIKYAFDKYHNQSGVII